MLKEHRDLELDTPNDLGDEDKDIEGSHHIHVEDESIPRAPGATTLVADPPASEASSEDGPTPATPTARKKSKNSKVKGTQESIRLSKAELRAQQREAALKSHSLVGDEGDIYMGSKKGKRRKNIQESESRAATPLTAQAGEGQEMDSPTVDGTPVDGTSTPLESEDDAAASIPLSKKEKRRVREAKKAEAAAAASTTHVRLPIYHKFLH